MQEGSERYGAWIGVKAAAPWIALGAGICAAIVLAVSIATGDRLCSTRMQEWAPWVAGAGLTVWVAAFFWERKSLKHASLFTAVMVGIAAAAVVLQNGKTAYKTISGDRIRTWSTFHYYIGSKYFPELGYRDLYRATLAADDEWQEKKKQDTAVQGGKNKGKDFGQIAVTRDMSTYKKISRSAATSGYTHERFSAERWKQFGVDTRLIRKKLKDAKWEQVFVDLGNNAAPAWNLIGFPLANLIPLNSKWFVAIAASDLPMHLAIFVALFWAFGIRIAAAAALWMNAIDFNDGRLLGGFLQYDWLASCALGLALYRKGRPIAAGTAMSWAVTTRVFPVFMVVPIFVRCVSDLARKRTDGLDASNARLAKMRLRFMIALTVCSIALAAISHVNGRGAATWPEWLEKISVHSRLHPVTSNQRIGVGRLALHSPSALDSWSEIAKSWEERLDKGRLKKLLLQILAVALLLAAVLRRKDEDAMIMMLFASFAFVTVSRYYASIWILLFALGQTYEDKAIRWPSALTGAILFAMAGSFFAFEGDTARYFLANYEAYLMFCLLCVGYVASDLRQRLRARK